MAATSKRFLPILKDAFQQGCDNAENKVTSFFRSYSNSIEEIPDERGLTDQVLLELKTAMPTLTIERSTQQEEGYNGTDYTLRFATDMGQKRTLYLQAKSIKGNMLIDFTYKNTLGKQFHHILYMARGHNENPSLKDEMSLAIGGYIIYSGEILMFIPVEELVKRFDNAVAENNGQEAAANKSLAKYYWANRKKYPLINMYIMSA
ncbi:hypothetical protein CPB86DRAFT_791938 [Serendipita vermifera]|nr:hypothetical protein CPB86DRAFT_791938 [Serendipita vermifera]